LDLEPLHYLEILPEEIQNRIQPSGTIHLGKYEVITQSLGDDSLTFDDDTVGFDDSSSEFIYSELSLQKRMLMKELEE
jgi:hypothetical protein